MFEYAKNISIILIKPTFFFLPYYNVKGLRSISDKINFFLFNTFTENGLVLKFGRENASTPTEVRHRNWRSERRAPRFRVGRSFARITGHRGGFDCGRSRTTRDRRANSPLKDGGRFHPEIVRGCHSCDNGTLPREVLFTITGFFGIES